MIVYVTYNASPVTTLTIGKSVLNTSDDVIFWETYDSKITFEKHLRSVSRAAAQWLGILRKSCQVFHDRSLLGRCFQGFLLPVFEYCSAVWWSAADTHLKILDRVVSGASLFTGDVFECDRAHRWSMAVLCMLYKIRCNPMHPLYGARPVPYVPVQVTRGAVIAHRYTYVFSLQNVAVLQDFYSPVSISVAQSWWPRIGWCGTGGFQVHGQCLFVNLAARLFFSPAVFPFSSFILWVGIVELGSLDR